MKLTHKSLVILLLYTLSGMAALAYEVLWTRMLSLLFGVSILGVVVTVAAFMLGLGLGSSLGYRWHVSLKNTLRTLACIEIGVALYALCLPLMMPLLQGLWLSFDDVQTWQLYQIITSLMILSVPALALGLAFPWMLRVGKSCDLSLASLYGVNTLGGAIGALLPLFLLPWLGWFVALQTIAGLGITVGLGLWYLSMREPKTLSDAPVEIVEMVWPKLPALFAYAGMGAGALMLEIAWTRAYGMILLRTEYVLAVILAVFLVGIGLGSLFAKRLPRLVALKYLPISAALMAILALYAFPYVNSLGKSMLFDSLWAGLLFQASLIAVCTLPITLALGAWLPLIAKTNEGASLYAANSLGACVGALLAGFILIPYLGTALTWVLAAVIMMLCAYYWFDHHKRFIYASLMAVALMLLAWPVYKLPDASLLLAQELGNGVDLYQYEDALSITHVVKKQDGQRILLADLQRMDASSDSTSVAVQRNQARLALFLHPDPKQVLFLGLGTGITASGALAWPQAQLHAVELSHGAITAARDYFQYVNDDITQHIDLQQDDARRFLMRSHQTYDVIIGDLFHPDQVGRGALLSVQQFKRAKDHLAKQGLFVQWLAINQFDIESLQVVLRSFAQAFPYNQVFIDGYRMALVGYQSKLHHSAANLLQAAPKSEFWGEEGGWTWLGRYWGDIPALLKTSNSTAVQGEWTPVIEFSLPYMRYKQHVLPDVLYWLIAQRIAFEDAQRLWQIKPQDQRAFKRAWVATALFMRGQWAALQAKPESARLQALAYRANPLDRWASFALADAMFASLAKGLPQDLNQLQALQRILAVRPDHEGALQALLKLYIEQGNDQMIQSIKQSLHQISPYAKHL